MPEPAEHHPRLLLPAILAAAFLYGFDLNVVNVALPSLATDLHAGPAALELVVGGYTFAYAAGLVTGGRLGDIVGHRRMFLVGMAAFAVASALCGLAQSPAELVGARLVQGLTAAAMVPQVLAMITTTFSPAGRARALAAYGVTAAVSGICGQVLGGLLLVANVFGLGWRVIFLLNVPVAAVALVVAVRVLPRREVTRGARLDPLGTLGVSATLGLALAPLVLGRQAGWPAWTWIALAGSVPVAAATIWWQRRLARAGGAPLLDLSLFAHRRYRLGLGINAAFMATFTSVVFVVSLLLQDGLRLTPMQAGLSFVPMALLGIAVPPVGRRLIARYGTARVVVIGCGVNAAALVVLALALHALRGGVALPWLVVPLALLGVGNTLMLPALLGATLAGVAPARAGIAAGTLTTGQQFAGTAGLAVLGTVFFALVGARPTRADYTVGVEAVVWGALALTALMAALALRLAHTPATTPTPTPTTTTPSPTLATTAATTTTTAPR